jgi:hypothetical protein
MILWWSKEQPSPKKRDTSFICTNHRLDAEQVEVYVELLVTGTRAADSLRLGLMTLLFTPVSRGWALSRFTPGDRHPHRPLQAHKAKHPRDHPCIFMERNGLSHGSPRRPRGDSLMRQLLNVEWRHGFSTEWRKCSWDDNLSFCSPWLVFFDLLLALRLLPSL